MHARQTVSQNRNRKSKAGRVLWEGGVWYVLFKPPSSILLSRWSNTHSRKGGLPSKRQRDLRIEFTNLAQPEFDHCSFFDGFPFWKHCTIQPIISTLKTKADTYHDGKKHTTKNMPSVTAFHKAAQSRWRFSKFWRSSDAIELSKENTISLGFQALSKIQTMEELVPVFSPKDIAHSRRSI